MEKITKQECFTWNQFDTACSDIVAKIRQQGWSFNTIYGLPRGGLIIAVKLSHLLNLKLILNSSQIDNNTLVVDDIADTGKSLQKLIDEIRIKSHVASYRVVTLFYHKQSEVAPDIWLYEKTDRWIHFPWEK